MKNNNNFFKSNTTIFCLPYWLHVSVIRPSSDHPDIKFKRVTCSSTVAQWLRCCATNRNVGGSIPASVSGFFIDIKSFRSRYGPGVDSASNRNEYQEHFLGLKATLPPSCAVVMKSGNINFLEPSGPLQAFTCSPQLMCTTCICFD